MAKRTPRALEAAQESDLEKALEKLEAVGAKRKLVCGYLRVIRLELALSGGERQREAAPSGLSNLYGLDPGTMASMYGLGPGRTTRKSWPRYMLRRFPARLRTLAKDVESVDKEHGGALSAGVLCLCMVDPKWERVWRACSALPAILRLYAAHLERKLKGQGKRKQKEKDPGTKWKVQLVEYVRDCAGKKDPEELSCLEPLATLISAEYGAAGLSGNLTCEPDALRLLWKRNPGLRLPPEPLRLAPIKVPILALADQPAGRTLGRAILPPTADSSGGAAKRR